MNRNLDYFLCPGFRFWRHDRSILGFDDRNSPVRMQRTSSVHFGSSMGSGWFKGDKQVMIDSSLMS
jgi:hypothetical protein